MMWMMLVCCLVPVAILLFAGGQLSGSGYLWPILIGGMIIAHLTMMFKGHGGHKDDDTEETSTTALDKPEGKDEHKEDKHGGCCH